MRVVLLLLRIRLLVVGVPVTMLAIRAALVVLVVLESFT